MLGLALLARSTRIVMVADRRDLVVRAIPRLDVVDVHPVQLFQCAVLALDDEEVDDEDGEQVAAGKDVSVGKVDCAGDEGGEESNR